MTSQNLELSYHQVLGKGGFGLVYRATDCLSTQYAVKLVMETTKNTAEQAMKVAVREYSIWQNLNHQNIVRCLGRSERTWMSEELGKEVKATVFKMEFLDGGDLFDQVKFGGAFSENASRLLFKQLMEGVHHIHQKGISHLDLKLDNIFVNCTDDLTSSQGLLKIGDFGLSVFT